jgi:hypothetical protein
MGRACSIHGKDDCAYKILARKPKERRPLGSWMGEKGGNNIKMNLKQIWV